MTTTIMIAPASAPTINLSLRMLFSGDFARDLLQSLEDGWRTHGNLYAIQTPVGTFTIISSPEYAQEVLINQRETFLKMAAAPRGDLLSPILGNGLVTNADYDSWFTRRRMMQPMFHRRRLAAMAGKMTDAGERMLDRWAQLPADTIVDVSQEMGLLTMDVVTQVMFSADIRDQSQQVGLAVGEALETAFDRRTPLKTPLWLPTPTNRRYKRNLATIDTLIYDLIDSRRGHEAEYDDLLSMLLEARDEDTGKGMTSIELRDEVAGIFGAGHETTSLTLAWTLCLLSQHPQVLHNLRDELDSVLGGRTPTISDLPNLPYTKMVIEESMRMMPAIPIVPRHVSKPAMIDGFQVPVSLAVISVWNIHHHPDHWENPNMFNPERMHVEQKKGRHRLAWMPFGAGQRMCIGSNMALVEGQLLLAQMVQRFNFELHDQHVEKQLAIALRPKNGLKMRLSPRV